MKPYYQDDAVTKPVAVKHSCPVDEETFTNLLLHLEASKRTTASMGCIYPQEAESIYWLVDVLRERLESAYSKAADIDAAIGRVGVKTDSLCCDLNPVKKR